MINKQWTSQNRIKEKSANWRIFFWGVVLDDMANI